MTESEVFAMMTVRGGLRRNDGAGGLHRNDEKRRSPTRRRVTSKSLEITRNPEPNRPRLHRHNIRLRPANRRRTLGIPRKLPAIVERIREKHVEAPEILPEAARKIERRVARHVARELALVKVIGIGEQRVEAMRIADTFRARVVDTTLGSFVFELTGAVDKIDAFIELMRPIGLAEVSRTGIAAIARGAGTI